MDIQDTLRNKPGYQFIGWYVDEQRTKRLNPGGILPQSMTIYDKWAPEWFPIHYELYGGENNLNNPHLISVESYPLPLHPPVKEGLAFMGWYTKDGKKIDKLPTHHIGPLFLEAHYASCVEVVFKTNGGTRVETQYIAPGSTIRDVPVPKKHGYMFAGWYLDDQLSFPFRPDIPISENIFLKAKWEKKHYHITYDTGGGINSRRNPTEYVTFENTVQLHPARKKGYEFLYWLDQYGTKRNDISRGYFGDLKLKAVYEKKDDEER